MNVSECLERRGEYRRSILLRSFPDRVEGELEDNVHHFQATIWHDGKKVLRAEGKGIRFPYSTCGGGAAQVSALEGMDLTEDLRAPYQHTNVREQCTHTFQLAAHAVTHAKRGEPRRLYEMFIQERLDGTSLAVLRESDRPLLSWELRDELLLTPVEFAGLTPTQVAEKVFSTGYEEGEMATMLRRAVGQSLAQRRVTHLQTPFAAGLSTSGVCYTFQPARAVQAASLDSIRNFENGDVWPLRERTGRGD